eukprot:Rmarinus@m.2568
MTSNYSLSRNYVEVDEREYIRMQSGSNATLTRRFSETYTHFQNSLRQCGWLKNAAHRLEKMHPVPMSYDFDEFLVNARLCAAIRTGMEAVVNSWLKRDKEVLEYLRLDTCIENMIRHHYVGNWTCQGTFRPDLLIPDGGDLRSGRVCEINCRMPANVYLITNLCLNSLMQCGQDWIPNCFSDIEVRNQQIYYEALVDRVNADSLDPNITGVFPVSICEEFLRCFDPGFPVTVVKSPLTNHGCIYMVDLLNRRHVKGTEVVAPWELSLQCNGACDSEKCDHDLVTPSGNSVRQVYLDVHQYELESLPTKVLDRLCTPGLCRPNDLIMVYLCHDKRMLALLQSKKVMSRLLGKDRMEIVNTLANRIQPTQVVELLSEDHRRKLCLQRARYVIKASRFGKGRGFVFGADVSLAEWEEALADAARATHVVQPVLKQRVYALSNSETFACLSASGKTPSEALLESDTMECHVVGTLLGFGRMHFGAGIFRASPTSTRIVNVSTHGGSILVPFLTIPPRLLPVRELPAPAGTFDTHAGPNIPSFDYHGSCSCRCTDKDKSKDMSSSFISAVSAWKKALRECGGCMIRTCFNDTDASFLRSVVGALGVVNPHDGTASSTSEVWDIRYEASAFAVPPRSKTLHDFRLHTDCCFEDPPPQFMALQVVSTDRLHGGASRVVDGLDVQRRLSPETVSLLRTAPVPLAVPPEFHKGTDVLWCKLLFPPPVWSSAAKQGGLAIRYRRDVVVRRQDSNRVALNDDVPSPTADATPTAASACGDSVFGDSVFGDSDSGDSVSGDSVPVYVSVPNKMEHDITEHDTTAVSNSDALNTVNSHDAHAHMCVTAASNSFTSSSSPACADPATANGGSCLQVSQEVQHALEELQREIDVLEEETLTFTLLPRTILILDNFRFLHSREEVLDPKRHLRRIRFHPHKDMGN